MIKKMSNVLLPVLCVAVLTGCATQGAPVSILYAPTAGEGAERGELFLKTSGDPVVASGTGYVRWVIGKREDAYGTTIGEILSSNSAKDTVLDALKSELTAAGYRVVLGPNLPVGAARGLELDTVQVEVQEKVKFPRVEASGKVGLTLAVWKKGRMVRKMSYRTENSDIAVLRSDRLPRSLVEQGLHDVMRQAVPDIVKELEGWR